MILQEPDFPMWKHFEVQTHHSINQRTTEPDIIVSTKTKQNQHQSQKITIVSKYNNSITNIHQSRTSKILAQSHF
jgi:hypothetical protein